MRKALLSVIALLSFAMTAHAAGIHVSADHSETRDGKFFLTGNVRIERDGATITSDEATYDEATGQVQASGGVFITDVNSEASATRADYNINNSTGLLYDAALLVGDEGYTVRSSEIRIISPGQYDLGSASVTTCKGLPPAWCIKGTSVDVTAGKGVSAWNATLRLGGVPVFYTPYIYAPIVDERSTGLLIPSIGYRSATGYFFSQPFYWAISETMDSTLRLTYHSDHAFGQALEFRFLTGQSTGGEILYTHIRDYSVQEDYSVLQARYDERAALSAGMDINLVDQQDYYVRYSDLLTSRASRYLDSRAEVWREFSNHSRLFMDSVHKYDLKASVDNDTVLQRVAGAGLNIPPMGLGLGFMGYARVEAAEFHRTLGYTARRTRANAGVIHSLPTALNLTQRLEFETGGYEYTNSPAAAMSNSAEYVSYNARAGFRAEAYHGDSLLLSTLEPSIDYTYLKRTGDEPLLLDMAETRQDRSELGLSLSQRLRGPGGRIMKTRLRQPMDISSASAHRMMPLSFALALEINPLDVDFVADYDHDTHKTGNVFARMDLNFRNLRMGATGSYSKPEGVETYTLRASYRAGGRWTLGAGARYNAMAEEELEQQTASVAYKSQCWTLMLRYTETATDYNVLLSASLLGLGGTPTQISTAQ